MEGPIRFSECKAEIDNDQIYFISYPLEKYLLEYLTKGVLWRNGHFRKDWAVNKPLTCVVGAEDTFSALSEVLQGPDKYKYCGQLSFFNEIGIDELCEFVYQKLVKGNPPFILLHGIQALRFSNPEEDQLGISQLVHELHKMQNQFHVPILLSAITELRHGDDNFPYVGSGAERIPLHATQFFNVQAPIGNYKLFQLVTTNDVSEGIHRL